jgi:hypothetical protein
MRKHYTHRTYRPDWVESARELYEAGEPKPAIATRVGVSLASINVWNVKEKWDRSQRKISAIAKRYGHLRSEYEAGASWPRLCDAAGKGETAIYRAASVLGWNSAAREEALKVIVRGGYDSATLARLRSKTHKHARRSAARGDVNHRSLAGLLASSPLCAYCGDPITEGNRSFDHIDPVSRGGEHSIDNLVVCCQGCNSSKRDHPLLVWLASRHAA